MPVSADAIQELGDDDVRPDDWVAGPLSAEIHHTLPRISLRRSQIGPGNGTDRWRVHEHVLVENLAVSRLGQTFSGEDSQQSRLSSCHKSASGMDAPIHVSPTSVGPDEKTPRSLLELEVDALQYRLLALGKGERQVAAVDSQDTRVCGSCLWLGHVAGGTGRRVEESKMSRNAYEIWKSLVTLTFGDGGRGVRV